MFKTILFLHGFLGRKEDFDTVIAHLPGFSCTAIDWGSVEDVRSAMRRLQPDVVVGYSMGGRVALSLKAPSRVILSAHIGLSTPGERARRWEEDTQWIERLRTLPIEEFLSLWYAQPLFASLKGRPAPFQKHLDKDKLAAMLSELSLAKQDRYTDFPNTFFLCGKKDFKYCSLYRTLPHLELEGGHALHLENPRGCAEAIANFCRSLVFTLNLT